MAGRLPLPPCSLIVALVLPGRAGANMISMGGVGGGDQGLGAKGEKAENLSVTMMTGEDGGGSVLIVVVVVEVAGGVMVMMDFLKSMRGFGALGGSSLSGGSRMISPFCRRRTTSSGMTKGGWSRTDS